MNIKKQKKIFKKYPKIFYEKDMPMDKTCMCWGLECGDGWYNLIDNLCFNLQYISDVTGNQIVATQVKEKYGTLSFYTNGVSDMADDIIEAYSQISASICERCGSSDNVKRTKGYWIKYLCKKCREEEWKK